jgi:hypothetical protein
MEISGRLAQVPDAMTDRRGIALVFERFEILRSVRSTLRVVER